MDFSTALASVKKFTETHNKGVWLVPTQQGFALSVVTPKPEEIPRAKTAVFFNTNGEITQRVESSVLDPLDKLIATKSQHQQ